MLHTTEPATPKTTSKTLSLAAFALLAALVAVPAYAQDAPPQPTPDTTPAQSVPHVSANASVQPSRAASYDNRYEIYGGLSFMNGQAGQNLPKRYDMGGGEGMFTYWLGDHLGVAADYRWEAGTTPIFPNPYYNRVLVMQNIYSGGVQWRGPKNRYVAIDYHALFGASRGTFDHAIQNFPGGSPISATGIGLYPNTTTPWGAAGGSIDFNYSANIAIRIAPDLIVEHFGTETREFVSVSGGVIYRFGKKR
jgi:hypothetical protein